VSPYRARASVLQAGFSRKTTATTKQRQKKNREKMLLLLLAASSSLDSLSFRFDALSANLAPLPLALPS
jgi:hypothetical protein